MAKISAYIPVYQLSQCEYHGSAPSFRHEGTTYLCKIPFFGMTLTQKVVLAYCASMGLPPVTWVSHQQVRETEKSCFRDPKEMHRWYHPYAETTATVQCIGEDSERQLTVYYCRVKLYEEKRTDSSKEIFVKEVA